MKFCVGDNVISDRRGSGVVVGINRLDKEFRYNVRFDDGNLAWYDGRHTELRHGDSEQQQ